VSRKGDRWFAGFSDTSTGGYASVHYNIVNQQNNPSPVRKHIRGHLYLRYFVIILSCNIIFRFLPGASKGLGGWIMDKGGNESLNWMGVHSV